MRIAIIGAGIGGLASATYLARDGHDVALFEAFKEPRPVGAGLLLQPPGQDVLKELGAFQAASKTAIPIHRLHSTTAHGRQLLDLSYSDLSGPPRGGLGIQRSTLHQALLAAAQSTNTELYFDATVTGLDRKADGCHIRLQDAMRGPFDLILVSSGSKSAWLQDSDYGRKATVYPWGCMWATVPLPDTLDGHTLHQRCLGAKHMVGLLPVMKQDGTPHAALYWSMKNSDAGSWHQTPYDAFLNKLDSIWPEAASAAAQVDQSAFVHATYRDVWCSRPYNDRVWLMGDAAHGTSPQLGQGCSMALLDAQAVSAALRQTLSLGDAVQAYNNERRAQLRYVRWASRLLTPLFQHDSRLFGAPRDLLLGPISSMPGFYGLSLRTLASDLFLMRQ
ncbi:MULTISPECIES: FAD-dependent oxidoreductase [Kordiimonas]|jgi:2-polyprenyl-6-methoxyphenol hydroxylase-like FAD-dependent oxidoreductase|uniref:FAD-dependent oxidoreductase n=1 Tax=Kordiimonas TaxID=288021 RepID=UPI0025804C9E|nr:NAD(P)/FAD-dependent oxidoreductase [Kordiimonas sp. UBA4487]